MSDGVEHIDDKKLRWALEALAGRSLRGYEPWVLRECAALLVSQPKGAV